MSNVSWTVKVDPLPAVLTNDSELAIGFNDSFEVVSAAIIYPIGGGWDEFDITDRCRVIPPTKDEEE